MRNRRWKSAKIKEENFAIFMFFLCSCVLCFDKLHVKSLIIYNSSYFIQQFITTTKHAISSENPTANKKKNINLLVYVISCWLCLALHSLIHQQTNTKKKKHKLNSPTCLCVVIILWVIILSSHSSLFNHGAMLQSFAYLVKVFRKLFHLKDESEQIFFFSLF